jgi:HSP20 family protein
MSESGLSIALSSTNHQATQAHQPEKRKGEQMAEKTTDVISRNRERLARREPLGSVDSPFSMLERFADEVDRVFDQFGLGRSWIAPRQRGRWFTPLSGIEAWAPDVEVYQRNNDLVVRADLPGMKKDDVSIDVTDGALTISGERRQEQETDRGGVYRSERSYGSFCRTIPLPEGAIADQAKATFKDGVLEVTMPAPPEQVTRGRRLEIKEGADEK